MELYKVTRGNYKKKFYESKKAFELFWANNVRYSKHEDIIAYKLDWEKRDWVCIRAVGPNKCFKSE